MPKLIANTRNMSHEDWLQLRKQGLGGSDASAVAGLSKYSSPFMVYADKMGLFIPEKPQRVQESAYWGNTMEPIVRREFLRRINMKREEEGKAPMKVIHRKAIFAHDEYDFIRTNLDGILSDPERGKGVFEAKTASQYLADEWKGEDVPDAYMLQVQHNMAVMGYDYAYLAVLIGGNDFRYYYIPRDEQMIADLLAIEVDFWQTHIINRVVPGMSGIESEKDFLEAQTGEAIERNTPPSLPAIAADYVEEICTIKEIKKTLDQQQMQFENELKAMMGNDTVAYAGEHRIKWSNPATGSRRFTISADAHADFDKKHNAKMRELKTIRKGREQRRKEIDKARKAELKAQEKERKEILKVIAKYDKKLATEMKEKNIDALREWREQNASQEEATA